MKKAIPFIFVLALCVAFVSACDDIYDYDDFDDEIKYTLRSESVFTVQENTLTFSVKDFDLTKSVIEKELVAVGGKKDDVTERKYANGEFNFSYKLLIPTDKKEQFIKALKGAEGIKVSSETTRLHTLQNDSASLTAKKNALSETYQSLNALLSDDSKDRVSIVKEMNSVNEQIKELQTRIDLINELSGFSTVHIMGRKKVMDVEDVVAMAVGGLIAVSGLTVATVLTVIRIKRKKAEKKNENGQA